MSTHPPGDPRPPDGQDQYSYYDGGAGSSGYYTPPRRSRGFGIVCIIVGAIALVLAIVGVVVTALMLPNSAAEIVPRQVLTGLPAYTAFVLLIVAGVRLTRN